MSGKTIFDGLFSRAQARRKASRFERALARMGEQQGKRVVDAQGIVMPIGGPVMTHRFAQRLLRRASSPRLPYPAS